MNFSIVIPLFNASNTILNALLFCKEQSFLPKEIIIVDDCSSDDSFKKVAKWKEAYCGDIKIIIEKLSRNSGPSKARNRGWELATGEYVVFLDADDRFEDNKLEVIHDFLSEYPHIVLLGHQYGFLGQTYVRSGTIRKLGKNNFLKKNYFTTSAVIVKRDIKERFDESMRYTEDQDLFLRVTQKYNETYMLESVLVLREREMNEKGGLSGNLWAMRKGEIKMYRKYCQGNNSILLFPFFLLYSLLKHSVKMIKGIS